jgi:peroxiredoxin
MRSVHLVCLAVLIAIHSSLTADAQGTKESSESRHTAESGQKQIDPTILLIRDDAVRAELKCTEDQRRTLDELLKKHNRMLLAIRDVGPTGADETAQPALLEIRDELRKVFNEAQRKRLQGLNLQAQGYDSLLRPDVVAKLKLTEEQRQQLASIAEELRAKAQEWQKDDANVTAEQTQAATGQLQKERQQRVLKILDPQQTEHYSSMLGEPFDFSKVKPSPASAPEFESIEEWINSDPVTMESLRGQVVVVHFFAFGCINCIHNFPWYREWYDSLQGKGVAIIGIHTPETQTEQDNNLLRQALEKYTLKFPVAVDKQKKMWKAWYNGIWPSVYIIDKHGRVRYWWYGELDWQGAGNQKVALRQIEQLLAEK